MVLDQDKEIQNTFSTFSLLWELCNDAQEVFVVLRFHLAKKNCQKKQPFGHKYKIKRRENIWQLSQTDYGG